MTLTRPSLHFFTVFSYFEALSVTNKASISPICNYFASDTSLFMDTRKLFHGAVEGVCQTSFPHLSIALGSKKCRRRIRIPGKSRSLPVSGFLSLQKPIPNSIYHFNYILFAKSEHYYCFFISEVVENE